MDPELLRETEELLQAQKLMIRRCESQIANRDECIRNLMQLAHLHGATGLEISAAVTPLFRDTEVGVPAKEQGPGETEPMERDAEWTGPPCNRAGDDDAEHIRNHDPEDHPFGHKTLKLRTIGHD